MIVDVNKAWQKMTGFGKDEVDEEHVLLLMEKVLKRSKEYIIDKADNGNDALIKIGIFSPDLVYLISLCLIWTVEEVLKER